MLNHVTQMYMIPESDLIGNGRSTVTQCIASRLIPPIEPEGCATYSSRISINYHSTVHNCSGNIAQKEVSQSASV
jgi:hypothetical protein